ncbi:MAG: response regulator [Acidimicrobiia bacterium]|nr:response regulator [Acidimicrobiia bacterium]NNF09295.1 response regulator [Acidimicrobiia bacterium]NNL70969.1 response regulator [Acidimicrobiia bacterium]
MDWNQDDELQAIFRTEMEERAPHLVAGAQAMIDGTLSAEITEQCVREAHTIKGTAKVMGYDLIGDAGGRLETDWRAIADHTLEPSAELGRRFLALSSHLLPAVDGDPQQGTPELSDALRAVIHGEEVPPIPEPASAPAPPEAISMAPELPGPEPEPVEADGPSLIVIDGSGGERPSVNPNVGNLGGLLASSENFSAGETTGVDTAKLYRLINRVAELRLDAEALAGTIEALRMAATASPSEVAALASRWETAVADIGEAVTEIQNQAVTLVAVPLSTVTSTVPGLVRFLARKTGREVRLEIIDDDIEVDLQILENLGNAFRNLVVNSIEHGIENPEERVAAGKSATGTLRISAEVEDGRLSLSVSDDGRGMNWELLKQTAIENRLVDQAGEITEEQLRRLLFETGISTSPTHSELSGSGQGFNAVARLVREMRGTVRLQTEPGAGTTVTITVPAFQSLQRALIVEAAGRRWGLAEPAVLDRFALIDADRVTVAGSQEVVWGDGMLPIGSFANAAGLPDTEAHRDVVVVSTQTGPAALAVTSIVGVREVATKSLGPLVSGTDLITGAALLGGGELALMLDANALGESSRKSRGGVSPDELARVLVVDDSPGVRQIVAGALAAGGFDTVVAGSAEEALEVVSGGGVDAIVVDYSMPGSDGISVVERVRARSTTLPIVMMSAVAERADQDRAKAAGVDAYFDKSDFREGALVSTLHSLLERADRGREAHAQ